MNVIFLDIDGVLNSMAYFKSLGKINEREYKGYQEISDYHLQMLSKIYHSCNAFIVLSSTWRMLDDEKEESDSMYQYLIDSLAKYDMRIMSKTPCIGQNRPLEINTWLNNRVDKDDIKFVSLDDDFKKKEYDAYGIGNCLVHTDFYCNKVEEGGLQQRHVDMAIRILNH